MAERKGILLRLDPAVHDALARWASDELRSTNAQIEFLLRRALADAGRMPDRASRMRGRGRPRKDEEDPAAGSSADTAEDPAARAPARPADRPPRPRAPGTEDGCGSTIAARASSFEAHLRPSCRFRG